MLLYYFCFLQHSELNDKKIILPVIVAIAFVILINWLSGFVTLRLDLTEEKRFTLSDVSKTFLQEQVSDDLHITLYLDGNINSGFKRLERASLAMLKQFQAQNKKHLSYSHIIIDDIKDKKAKESLLEELSKLGITPTNIIDEDNNGKRIQKSVYPWALVDYKGRKFAVNLLLNIKNRSGSQNINSSIENLEYHITEAFRILSDTQESRIAFLEGHGELGEGETYDITSALSQYYYVDRGRIGDDASILDPYKAVIIAQPTEAFSESDKYVLDQYLMKGGKLLWLVDGVKMSMDSLRKAELNYGIYNDVGLSDMLFRYGVRINPNLIQDVQCALYPVNIAGPQETARYQPLPWFYSPLLMPNSSHAITRHLSNVKSEFVSSIDLVGNDENISKSVLLSSSPQSKLMPVPIQIDLAQSAENFKLEEFNAGQQTIGVLLEGRFSSVFANRIAPRGLTASETLKTSEPTKMIVIADGSVIENELRGYGEETQVVPLGYDYATNQVLFGNKAFLLNAINYLTDDEGWYTLRERTIKLRLLDQKEMERRQYYRIINIVVPLVLLLLLSLLLVFVRKRRYTK